MESATSRTPEVGPNAPTGRKLSTRSTFPVRMNARRLAVATTAAALSLTAAPASAATPPDGAVSCAENAFAAVAFWIENGYVQPAPPCKPLS
jgi:hypothetical protein